MDLKSYLNESLNDSLSNKRLSRINEARLGKQIRAFKKTDDLLQKDLKGSLKKAKFYDLPMVKSLTHGDPTALSALEEIIQDFINFAVYAYDTMTENDDPDEPGIGEMEEDAWLEELDDYDQYMNFGDWENIEKKYEKLDNADDVLWNMLAWTRHEGAQYVIKKLTRQDVKSFWGMDME